MTLRTWTTLAAAIAATLTLAACGSSSSGSDAPAGPNVVFADANGVGIDYQPFDGSNFTAHSVATDQKHDGASSFRVTIGASGYAGGTFVAATARDLSAYNAVTFWVRASQDAVLNTAGFAVNNTVSTPFKMERNNIAVGTTWTKVILPIPAPSKLTSERGLFHFADSVAAGDSGAYTLWFDEIKYELLPAADLGTPAPAIATETKPLEVGGTVTVAGAAVTYTIGGAQVILVGGNRFFTWASSDPAATVDQDGKVTGVSPGTALITARLGTVDAAGTTTVTVSAAQAPTVAAPAPTAADADAIWLFVNGKTSVVPGADWGTSWSNNGGGAHLTDLQVAGDDVKKYTGVIYAGVDFSGAKFDATGMTHFHVDVWTPNATKFGVKLVSFGTATTEGIAAYYDATTPAITQAEWISLDIPLTAFAGLTPDAIAQILWLDNDDAALPDTGNEQGTFFIDNVYFHK